MRPAATPVDHPVHHTALVDSEAPLFALVRAAVGLPAEDRRWWPEEILPAVHVTHPSIDLLERTLAGLRAVELPQPRTRSAGRHARR